VSAKSELRSGVLRAVLLAWTGTVDELLETFTQFTRSEVKQSLNLLHAELEGELNQIKRLQKGMIRIASKRRAHTKLQVSLPLAAACRQAAEKFPGFSRAELAKYLSNVYPAVSYRVWHNNLAANGLGS
jgi:hypothetical protein